MVIACALFLTACKKEADSTPGGLPPATPSKSASPASKYAGYYRVDEEMKAVFTGNLIPAYFTFLGIVNNLQDTALQFLQSRRPFLTWWNFEPAYRFYGGTRDTLVALPGINDVSIVNGSTVTLDYAWLSCFDQYSIKQTRHRIKTVADTASYNPLPDTVSTKTITLAGRTLGQCQTGAGKGDGGPASGAFLAYPCDVAVDNSGNVFGADAMTVVQYLRLRKTDEHCPKRIKCRTVTPAASAPHRC